ncbi:ankyrin repeat-containing domain, PGG domain protein [Tanacetum coccineum]
MPHINQCLGPKREYLRIGVPLYEASIKCDWEAAKYILDKKPELVSGYDDKGRLGICKQNSQHFLAAAAGNLETVKIMVKKNRALLIIPSAGKTMMPLYAAVLFGNNEVVKYLFQESKDLSDDGWTYINRSWLLEKCVESDMFDKHFN